MDRESKIRRIRAKYTGLIEEIGKVRDIQLGKKYHISRERVRQIRELLSIKLKPDRFKTKAYFKEQIKKSYPGVLDKIDIYPFEDVDLTSLTMGQRIRIVRGNRTQTQFGKLLNKSQDTVSVYENDFVEPPVDILAKIAKLGHVSLDWLAQGSSTVSHKNRVIFKGRILKPKTPEWRILGIMTGLNSKRMKDKIVELIDSFIEIDYKT